MKSKVVNFLGKYIAYNRVCLTKSLVSLSSTQVECLFTCYWDYMAIGYWDAGDECFRLNEAAVEFKSLEKEPKYCAALAASWKRRRSIFRSSVIWEAHSWVLTLPPSRMSECIYAPKPDLILSLDNPRLRLINEIINGSGISHSFPKKCTQRTESSRANAQGLDLFAWQRHRKSSSYEIWNYITTISPSSSVAGRQRQQNGWLSIKIIIQITMHTGTHSPRRT